KWEWRAGHWERERSGKRWREAKWENRGGQWVLVDGDWMDAPAAPIAAPHTLTIIGTNDLHGALDRLPLLGGYMANLRVARAADGGGVVLVDGGDLFQGTLESNLAEGTDVVKAYNQLGYAATAIGNHEFDYGPVGPAVIAKDDQDPRGALKARVAEATFPFLVTNILDERTGTRIDWPNMPASRMLEVAGVEVGILGASTESTPYTTMPANFVGLKMATPTAQAITAEAQALRARGAQVVVLALHIGSACKDNDQPADITSCDQHEELFDVLRDVPKGLVDVVVAGHTHAAIAHVIDGMAVIESYSSGRAFGRVDLTVADGRVRAVAIHKPEVMCTLDKDGNPQAVHDCHPPDYEGHPVVPDPTIQKIVDDAMARTADQRNALLGVKLAATVTKAYKTESIEGDWFTDLMLAARPEASVALTNGGGLRADFPPGEITYGKLFEAMPFDNRFALVELDGKQLRRLVKTNLERDGAFFSFGGLTAVARCIAGKLDIAIKVGHKPLAETGHYTLVTTDFLASGGDGVIGKLKLPAGAIKVTDVIMREAIADVLRKQRGKTLDPTKLFDATHKRIDYEGKRPVVCAGSKPEDGE
ncbi:MAG TPA: 5'-nucleotidase C-terminal domain-containing protein, partial [Kofleriaceae bacterium]|nr:5'-nucleotidase C-terminal domain-containing protein [Kofleriaceae bacterium]